MELTGKTRVAVGVMLATCLSLTSCCVFTLLFAPEAPSTPPPPPPLDAGAVVPRVAGAAAPDDAGRAGPLATGLGGADTSLEDAGVGARSDGARTSPEALGLSDVADPAWRQLTADIRHALTHRVGLSDVAVLLGAHEIPTTVSGAEVFGPLFGDLVGHDVYARNEYERTQLPIDRRDTLQRYYLLKLRDALTNAACHLGRYDFTRHEFTPSCAVLPSWGGDRRLKFPGDLEWRIGVPESGAREVESAWRARRLVAEVVFHIVRVGDSELHVRIDAAIVEDQRTGDVVHRQMPEQLRPLRR